MYAIVEIAGQQFKAEAGKKIYVHRLEGNEGDAVSFDRVLLTEDGGTVKSRYPYGCRRKGKRQDCRPYEGRQGYHLQKEKT